jgi:MYXO-CTERM domain-containing protein
MSLKLWGLAGVTAGAGLVFACSQGGAGDAESAPQEVNERVVTLNAVVALEGGCTAVKVGPKHLLVAARCVANRPQYAIGKPLRFRKGNVAPDTERAPQVVTPDAAPDVVVVTDAAPTDAAVNEDAAPSDAALPVDAGAGPVAANDAGTDAGPVLAGEVYEETIAKVEIHPSFLQKCGTGACALGKPGAADVADVAVLITSREIVDVQTAPIDLDYVAPNESVLVISNGCDPSPVATPKLRSKTTKLVSADAVVHDGSPFQPTPELRTVLARSYVVTRGPANAPNSRDALGICSDKDLGAPLFRADGTAIVGINSNYTTGLASRAPVTNLHARVDLASQHNIGKWLGDLGAKTLSTCGLNDAGCATPPDGGGGPSGDAASEPDASLEPAPPSGGELPPDYPTDPSSGSESSGRTPPKETTSKKKSGSDSGCSAAPTGASSSSSLGLVAGLLLAVASRLRRRR